MSYSQQSNLVNNEFSPIKQVSSDFSKLDHPHYSTPILLPKRQNFDSSIKSKPSVNFHSIADLANSGKFQTTKIYSIIFINKLEFFI